MIYEVKIPDWSDGCPLIVTGIEADTVEDALAKGVAWVNRLALAWDNRLAIACGVNTGECPYCDALPDGTKVYQNGTLVHTVGQDDTVTEPLIVNDQAVS